MKTRTTLTLTAVIFAFLSMGIITAELYRTYRSARTLVAENDVHYEDCVYAGTKLSYDQIYTPPEFLRLPHWEVTYDSTNPLHRFTRMVTLSDARAKANNDVVRTR